MWCQLVSSADKQSTLVVNNNGYLLGNTCIADCAVTSKILGILWKTGVYDIISHLFIKAMARNVKNGRTTFWVQRVYKARVCWFGQLLIQNRMQPQVLRQEIFQLSEKITQLSYKIAKQSDPASRGLLVNKRASLENTRNNLKIYLRVLYVPPAVQPIYSAIQPVYWTHNNHQCKYHQKKNCRNM